MTIQFLALLFKDHLSRNLSAIFFRAFFYGKKKKKKSRDERESNEFF